MRVLRLCSVFEAPGDRVARFDPVGGMQTHTAELTRRLDSAGVTQHVLTTRPPGTPAEHTIGERSRVLRFGVPMPQFRQLWSGPALRAAWRLAREVDLVHVHLGEDLAVVPVARAVARRHGLPLVVTVHTSLRHTMGLTGPRAMALRALGGPVERWGVARSETVLTLTERLARMVQADGVPAERIHVIPSGVDAVRFDLDTHTHTHLADPLPDVGRPRVGFVGRLTSQKGVRGLIKTAEVLSVPGVQVVLVGDGPDRQRLERRVQKRGLTGRVHITGFVDHDLIPAVLAHLDVMVLPSVYEEFGSVLVEAMRVGVPIVATRVGGIPEVIEHTRTGTLVEVKNLSQLASAIDELLVDRERAADLAKAAKASAARYDWDALARSVHDVYQQLVPPGGIRKGQSLDG